MSLNGTTDNYLFVNNVPIAPKKYLAMLDYLWVNNNEIDMRRIRLTEGDLRRIVNRSVRRVMNEGGRSLNIRKKYKSKSGHILNADIKIHPKDNYGSYEYWVSDFEDDTYIEGGLWFDGKTVIDYDGCFELPSAVRKALNDSGYTFG